MAGIALLSLVLCVNLAMGVCVARSRSRAAKLLFIHLPVPAIIWLRHELDLDPGFIVLTLTTAIAGLLAGKWLYTRRTREPDGTKIVEQRRRNRPFNH